MSSEISGDASAVDIRVRFYVDGYHGYLLAQKAAAFHKTFWDRVRTHFPDGDPAFEILDFDPTPEKLADILDGLLDWSASLIVRKAEDLFRRYGHSVIPKTDVDLLSSGLYVDLFGKRQEFSSKDKIRFALKHDGIVFAPRFDKDRLLRDLRIWELSVGSTDDNLLYRISKERSKISSGHFESSQRFYRALGNRLGKISQEGYLSVQRNAANPVGEKSVDEDLNSSLWDDLDKPIDLFVLVTNDGDHAPHAKRIVGRGKRVAILSYTENHSRRLRDAVGDHNILNFMDCSRGFDFSDVWLKRKDKESFQALEDIQRQWRWWAQEKMVE